MTFKKALLGSLFVPVEESLLNVTDDKRQVALERCASYKESIKDYLAVNDKIPTGFKLKEEHAENKRRILSTLGGTEQDWQDWQWHMRNTITDIDILAKILELSAEEVSDIERVAEKCRWAISPYYASLMDYKDRDCPVHKQGVPSILIF